MTPTTFADLAFELHFEPLVAAQLPLSFPCDAAGCVEVGLLPAGAAATGVAPAAAVSPSESTTAPRVIHRRGLTRRCAARP